MYLLVTYMLLALIAPAVPGFHIPAGTPEGFYVTWINKFGQEEHHQVADISLASEWATSNDSFTSRIIEARGHVANRNSLAPVTYLAKRESEGLWCGCNFKMDQNDLVPALNNVMSQISSPAYIGAGLAYYQVVGSAVVFVCNKAPITVEADENDLIYAMNTISSWCGNLVPGTVEIHALDTGYMGYDPTVNYCSASTGSDRANCPGAPYQPPSGEVPP